MDDLYPDRPRTAAEYAERRRQRLAERAATKRRERARRYGRGTLLFGVVIAALLGAMTIYTVTVSVRATHAATALLDDADGIVVQADSMLRDSGAQDDAEHARGIAERVPAALGLLDRSAAALDPASRALGVVWRRPVHTREAIEARVAMMGPAPGLLENAAQARSARPLAAQASADVARIIEESSGTALPSADSSKKQLTAAVRAADGANHQLTMARERFAAAHEAFPQAGFSAYVTWVDELQRINRTTRQAAQAFLDDRDAAGRSALRTRARAERRAAQLQADLPKSIDAAIRAGTDAAGGDKLAIYRAARRRAVAADAALGRDTLQASSP